ncbi:DUF2512 family protein [Paenibacillus thermotolerans]|uniref:DUF2512 family protein n=1 Tax=Paenibacillus thermotolerans TaxID=3027807 RepID=UPI00236743CD|nr:MULTISPECIES: DUF2512 family protein [unclassified Paenibacillus]
MFVFLMKLVITPIGLWLCDQMLRDVHYPYATSIVLAGLLLAVVGYALEWLMLRRGTLWLTTVADWALSAAFIYASQYVIAGAYASVTGALLSGGILAIVEYFMHRYEISSGALATQK